MLKGLDRHRWIIYIDIGGETPGWTIEADHQVMTYGAAYTLHLGLNTHSDINDAKKQCEKLLQDIFAQMDAFTSESDKER